MMDVCGFAKEAFYLNKSQMSAGAFLHVLPHWNWPGHEGKPIKVLAFTNCPFVELFLNGKSFGRQRVDPAHGGVGCAV